MVRTAMPFHETVWPGRAGVLSCDGCGVFLRRDGTPSSVPFRDALPDDLAPHVDHASDLTLRASTNGWTRTRETWLCTSCAKPAKKL